MNYFSLFFLIFSFLFKKTFTQNNLALNKVCTASSIFNANYSSQSAWGGDKRTFWNSNENIFNELAVDFILIQKINRDVLYWSKYYFLGYQIHTSLDNIIWTIVFNDNSGRGGVKNILFDSIHEKICTIWESTTNK